MIMILVILLVSILCSCHEVAATAAAGVGEVWIGTSPMCDGQPRDCEIFDMKYIRSDKYGDGKYCLTGRKVLCRTKQLAGELIKTQNNKISIVSYNIFERPFVVTHDGQTERTCHIPRATLSEFPSADVMVFQEAFMGGCWYDNEAVSMKAQLRNYGFNYFTETVGSYSDDSDVNELFLINGGVFIASRWPIVKIRNLIYSNSGHADVLSRKGAVYVKLVKNNRNYHIIGTHMQAQIGYDKVRVQQAAELQKFIMKQRIPIIEPVLVAGDLNCDLINNPGNVRDVLNAMQMIKPEIVGNVDATLDPMTNDVVEDGNSLKEWLDYVVISRNHLQPKRSAMRSVRLRADKPVVYCNSAKLQPYYVWPWSAACLTVKSTYDLSDHYPVIAEFEF